MPPGEARRAAAAANTSDATWSEGVVADDAGPVNRLAFTKSDDVPPVAGAGPGARARKVRHQETVVRDDGSVSVVPMADYGPALPHDLAHFVVERELGLRWGFWGLVAAGARFDTLARAAKGTPAASRSDPLVATHRAELLVAEAVVNLLHRPDGDGALPAEAGDGAYQAAIAMLMSSPTGPDPAIPTVDDVIRTRAALTTMARRWRDLAPGDTIVEVFRI
jgi:hypothetical protein